MKHYRLNTIFLISMASLALSNCAMASFESNASGNSHNAGTNCMSCHSSGENSMTVAGTVYGSSSGATVLSDGTVKVIVGSGNTKYEIPVDKSGNFYTDYPVDFPGPVSLSNGNVMNTYVSNGNCNTSGCHDSSRRIY